MNTLIWRKKTKHRYELVFTTTNNKYRYKNIVVGAAEYVNYTIPHQWCGSQRGLSEDTGYKQLGWTGHYDSLTLGGKKFASLAECQTAVFDRVIKETVWNNFKK